MNAPVGKNSVRSLDDIEEYLSSLKDKSHLKNLQSKKIKLIVLLVIGLGEIVSGVLRIFGLHSLC